MGGRGAAAIRNRLSAENDHAAPHIIDAEVFGVIRREYQRGRLDRTEATQAVEDRPGERFGHRRLLARAWDLRDTVRGWDAMYVSLAEALDAVLLTTDGRLAAATGLHCPSEVIAHGSRK